MGDKLNRSIIREVFGYDIVRATPLTCEMSGIGSGLGHFLLSDDFKIAAAEKISSYLYPETEIWTTGFIENIDQNYNFYRKKIHFCAVRGQLTLQKCEKILKCKLNVPLGDGGLLAEYLLKKRPEKKYEVGIIAHYKEQEHVVFQQLQEKFKNACFIDVRKEPEEVIKKIAECECVLSSSLHGLIIADSLHIPNLHIKVTDALLGDGFKFDDYYSAFDIEHHEWKITEQGIDSLYQVYDQYCVSEKKVEEKKKQLMKAFPF